MTLAIIGLVVAIGGPIIGYFITSLHRSMASSEKVGKERHDTAMQAVRDTEGRCMAEIGRAEDRSEKGDARILEHVGSQYQEVNRNLREMRDDIKDLVKRPQ